MEFIIIIVFKKYFININKIDVFYNYNEYLHYILWEQDKNKIKVNYLFCKLILMIFYDYCYDVLSLLSFITTWMAL